MILKNCVFLMAISFLTLGQVSQVEAQETKEYKNSIYAGAGSVIFNNQLSLAYERTLFQKNKFKTKGKLQASKLWQGLDYDAGVRVDEKYIGLSVVQLFGIIEAGAGVAFSKYYISNGFIVDDPPPIVRGFGPRFYGNVGLRYEKNRFLIRAGVGNLEYLYLSIGGRF